MIYLLKGEGIASKEQAIAEIKSKVLNQPDAQRFDYEQFDAAKLKPADFKKALFTLPVIVKQRVVLIRDTQKLSTQNQGLLLDFAESKNNQCVLICDCSASSQKGFLKKIAKDAKVIDTGTAKKLNVFDMTKAMGRSQSTEALKILTTLLDDGNHPLQIMGGLVWFWGNNKNRLSAGNFQKGLRELQQADLNIKRSRLSPEHAVEILVTKLSVLSTR